MGREILSRSRVVLASTRGRPSELARRLSEVRPAGSRFTTPVFRERESGIRLALTDELTARFKAPLSKDDLRDLERSLRCVPQHPGRFDPLRWTFSVDVGYDGRGALNAANALAERDGVFFAQPNFLFEYAKLFTPSGPLWTHHWHLANAGQSGGRAGEDVRALGAWEVARCSPEVVVAVLDDGVDTQHPALRDCIWTNPSHDPELKDLHGYNFYDENNDANPRYFVSPYDQLAGNDIHGTPCAGILAAWDRDRGVYGIAFGAKILPVKIWGEDRMVPLSAVADAIRYAGPRAHVVSCSWKCPPDDDIHQAIVDVTKRERGGRGVPVFCASGNNGLFSAQTPVAYPARYTEAIAVGASTNLGMRAGYSQYGDELDFVAPSSGGTAGIFAADVSLEGRGFNLSSFDTADFEGLYTPNFGGTSAATPLAAGVAALLLSVNPALTAADIRSIMRETADKIDKPDGHYVDGFSKYYGYGRINAERAVGRTRQL